MPQAINIVTSRVPGGSGSLVDIPHFYYGFEGSGTFIEVAVPSEVDLTGATGWNRRPSHVEDRMRRHYFGGQFKKNVVFTEFLTLHPMGITAPLAPTLTPVAGGTITASNQIGYLSFRHKNGPTIIHESNLSPGSSTVFLDGTQQRQWTLPGVAFDSRVTHVVLWVSVDGVLPKEVTERPIADVTFTENTPTGSLGDPPPVDGDGNLKQARGKPPYARFIVKYHRRAWFGGDLNHPARWWFSELDEFESVGDLNFVEHLENETIVGGGAAGDHLLSCGQTVSYAIQGWDESDLRIYKVSPAIGTIHHFGIINVNEILWVPTELGYYVYVPGAGFRPLMANDLQSYWRETYEANPAVFEDCFAADDRTAQLVKVLFPMDSDPKGFYLVAHYRKFDPSVGEGNTLPDWTFDFRNRADYTAGNLRPANKKQTALHTGSTDGFIRRENVLANDDDDQDTYQKLMQFEPPHYYPKRQVGSDDDGVEFNELTVFLVAEENDWTIEGRAGEDSAYLATTPSWTEDRKASRETIGNKTKVPKTSHYFRPTGLAGKGVIFKVKVPKAKGVEYRGLALGWGDSGTNPRPLI